MMLGLAFLSLALAQQGSEAVVAVNPDDPLTWTLEYPILISPYIDGYYGCLKSRDVKIGPDTNFEAQHRSAISQCAKKKMSFLEDANEILAAKGLAAKTSPGDVKALLDSLELIHVARGKDLDDQMNITLGVNPYGQRMTAEGAVITDEAHAPVEDAVWEEEKQGEVEEAVTE